MENTVSIIEAKQNDANLVASLVYDLLFELFPEQKNLFPLAKLKITATEMLQPSTGVWSFLAISNGQVAGMINLNECAAIYAGGKFGEITEMYVKPKYRSTAIGEKLIQQSKLFAQERSWKVLEVGAPDLPRCQRTVDFYQKVGFNEVGPRLEMML